MTDTTETPVKAARATKAAAVEAHPSDGKNIIQLLDLISKEAGALAPASKNGVPFAFRGIDGTVAHLSNSLRKYGVIILPTVVDKAVTSAPSGNKVVTTSDLTVDFTFYAPDMSSVTARVAGLASDYSDRSTAQAHSVALRIALLQAFALPTHSADPEETSVEREAPAPATAQAAPLQAVPDARQWQAKVKTAWGEAGHEGSGYFALGNKLFGTEDSADWRNDVPKLQQVFEAILKGEVA